LKTYTLSEIALRTGAELRGSGSITITGVAPIESASEGEITFLGNRRYRRFLSTTRASAVIVPPDLSGEVKGAALISHNPYLCLSRVIKLFHPRPEGLPTGIHPTALIGEGTHLGEDVAIGPYVVIGNGCSVGDRTVICAGSVIGDRVSVGSDTIIYPNVTVGPRTVIGSRVILHPGAVLGADGFGFTFEGGVHHKIPQVGHVVVEDDVEIGANSAVDRATLGVTRIGRGTKIDNLVQVGHNVTIGENTVISGQAGISGSTRIGSGVWIGGQAGFIGHIEVGDGAMVGAQAGVTKSISPKSVVSGYPARPHAISKRIEAAQAKLPELLKKIREQEKRIESLEREIRNSRREV